MPEKFKQLNGDDSLEIIKDYSEIMNKTKTLMELWKDYGPENAPDQAKKELINVMYDWQIGLTDSLKRWVEIGENITIGDLILARINIGIIIENWLKFFLTVYADDFYKEEKTKINNLCFKELIKNFTKIANPKIIHKKLAEFDHFLSDEQLADEIKRREEEIRYFSSLVRWLNIIRERRNAVHAFNYSDIGNADDFLEGVRMLNNFIDFIMARLPEVESSTVF